MENLLSNQTIRKRPSHYLNCDWPVIKFLYFCTSAIFTSANLNIKKVNGSLVFQSFMGQNRTQFHKCVLLEFLGLLQMVEHLTTSHELQTNVAVGVVLNEKTPTETFFAPFQSSQLISDLSS